MSPTPTNKQEGLAPVSATEGSHISSSRRPPSPVGRGKCNGKECHPTDPNCLFPSCQPDDDLGSGFALGGLGETPSDALPWQPIAFPIESVDVAPFDGRTHLLRDTENFIVRLGHWHDRGFLITDQGPTATFEPTHFIPRDALLAASPSPWRSMSDAPKDGTLLQLLIAHDEDGGGCGGGFDDALKTRTMGFNNFDNDEIDEWKFPGWDWCHDCITEQGCGKPVAWALMLPLPEPPSEGEK